MIITAVTETSADKFLTESKKSDAIFCANVGETINFKRELKGEDNKLLTMGKLSKKADCTVVGGYYTENFGLKRNSVIVSDKGSVIGIADMAVSVGEKRFSLGNGRNVYSVSAGKIGVLIGDDILEPEALRFLTDGHADVVFASDVTCKPGMLLTVLQGYAYLYSVAMVCINGRRVTCVSSGGNIVYDGETSNITLDVDVGKTYVETIVKRRFAKKNK